MIDRVYVLFVTLCLSLCSSAVRADTIQIPLSGIGSIPSSAELSVSPALLELGDVEIGSQKAQEFSVSYTCLLYTSDAADE